MTSFTATQLRSMAVSLEYDMDGHGEYSKAIRQAAEDAEDAERWREFIRCGWPVCFLGETYDNAADLNAAVDTALKEPK